MELINVMFLHEGTRDVEVHGEGVENDGPDGDSMAEAGETEGEAVGKTAEDPERRPRLRRAYVLRARHGGEVGLGDAQFGHEGP